MASLKQITQQIKEKTLSFGFDDVGVSKAEKLEGFEYVLDKWLSSGYNADMDYMARNREKRIDPTLLVPGAKSVISIITSYFPEHKQPANVPQIAKYAYGKDYHYVLKSKMAELWDYIKTIFPNLDGRIFVDSAPFSDKLWAVKSGLGWIGKNSCLINKKTGSFVFISELVINIELCYDKPNTKNFCGKCTKCIDACPTQAIVQPGIIDGGKCLSYQTIENKQDTIPNEFDGKMNHRIFGCDICQDVCPWNKNPSCSKFSELKANPNILNLDIDDWEKMNQDEFNELFRKSALKRAKLTGIKRNLSQIKKRRK